ncbi:MAG: GNAT family N-acetyltransferase [Cyanobacteria bacterium P01_F01_bin.53]
MTSTQNSQQNTDTAYTIRPMTRDNLAVAVEWAAAEGWNPGLHDVDYFYAADPNGFLMGFLGDQPIASISVVKYGKTFGFLGFYIVRPEFRGRGYGWALWQAGLNYLNGRNIGLDGVVEQQNNYIKSGFKLAHRNIRYEGISKPDKIANSQLASSTEDAVMLSSISLDAISLDAIFDYDTAIFQAERSTFLEGWIGSPHHTAVGLVSNRTANHTSNYTESEAPILLGYGVLRPCRQGYKIGPLFADTAEYAEAIFLELMSHVDSGSPFYLDVPEVNAAAVALAEKYQMTSVFETARMYTQEPPPLPLRRIFGITTFELG